MVQESINTLHKEIPIILEDQFSVTNADIESSTETRHLSTLIPKNNISPFILASGQGFWTTDKQNDSCKVTYILKRQQESPYGDSGGE